MAKAKAPARTREERLTFESNRRAAKGGPKAAGFMSKLTDLNNTQASNVSDLYSKQFSLDGLANDPNKMDFSADRARVENSVFNQFKSRLDPQFQRDNDNFEQSMANKGIPRGSQLYSQMQNELRQSQNDAYTNAEQQAIQMGGTELGRSSDLALRARGQGVGEATLLRNQPFQELAGIAGLNQYQQTQDWQGKQNELDRANQRYGVDHQKGGASGPGYDVFALQTLKGQQDIAAQNNAARLAAANQPRTPNPYGQIGGQVAGAVGNAIGNSAGGFFSGLFGG